MFNITVNLKRLLKKLGLVFGVLCIFIFIIGLSKKYLKSLFDFINNKCEYILKNEISFVNFDNINYEIGVQKILNSELIVIDNNNEYDDREYNNTISNEKAIIENSEVEIKNETVEVNSNNDDENIDFSNLSTEVMRDKNLKESYNLEYNSVKIKNESKYNLSDEILNPNVEFNNKNILIFHTHTCESYTQTEQYKYKESGNFRTTDLNYSVAGVGDELSKCLIDKGFNVIHDTTYHDYPAYTGSYNRSLLTVKSILEKNPDFQIVIDLHRDAIGSNSDYGPAVKIGDERVAQIMFVMGTDGGGLAHPNWQSNLKHVIKIQEKANEMFPGLFRPIIVRNSRYNQNLAECACIIEVGATGNTYEECVGSMKYLAEVLDKVIIK